MQLVPVTHTEFMSAGKWLALPLPRKVSGHPVPVHAIGSDVCDCHNMVT